MSREYDIEQLHEQLGAEGEFHERLSKSVKGLYIFAVFLLTISLTISTFFIINNHDKTEELYRPLGEYSVQTIESGSLEHPGHTGLRVIDPSEPIRVSATKCVNGEDDISVSGVVSWQPVEPNGPVIEAGTGTRVQAPGCTEYIFENVIPPEVLLAFRVQYLDGISYPIWRITGVETPTNVETGEIGVSKTWVTSNFIVDNVPGESDVG
jgi:hypothetical protein